MKYIKTYEYFERTDNIPGIYKCYWKVSLKPEIFNKFTKIVGLRDDRFKFLVNPKIYCHYKDISEYIKSNNFVYIIKQADAITLKGHDNWGYSYCDKMDNKENSNYKENLKYMGKIENESDLEDLEIKLAANKYNL